MPKMPKIIISQNLKPKMPSSQNLKPRIFISQNLKPKMPKMMLKQRQFLLNKANHHSQLN